MNTASNPERIAGYGRELYQALRHRQTVEPLSVRDPSLTIDDAYSISLDFLNRRLADGEKLVGKKIGVTSKAVQDMLGVHQPDFGFLTDIMQVPGDSTVDIASSGLIQPRAEAEIGFLLKHDLKGPGVTEQDVLDATDSICACFEIVDSRITDWQINIVDTISDNASCGVFLFGRNWVNPRDFDLPALKATVWKNGAAISEGLGSAVQGSPLTAVAWLANTLGRYDVPFEAGEFILSGSLVPLEPVQSGDHFEMELSDIGHLSVKFE